MGPAEQAEAAESAPQGQAIPATEPGASPAAHAASQSPRDLTYAPPPAWHRRRLFRRAVLLLVFASVVGCLAGWRKPLLRHARLLYRQHQCAAYAFAPDGAVASVGPRAAIFSAPVPTCWTDYEASALPAPINHRQVKINPAFRPTLAFLHGLRSPAGHERIVAVRCVPMYLPSASVRQAFQTAVVERAPPWPLSSRPILHDGGFSGGFPIDVQVKVFGGQPDPADLSHFTIAYTVGGLPGTLDGWLADNDTVTLKVRPGSADVMDVLKARAAKR